MSLQELMTAQYNLSIAFLEVAFMLGVLFFAYWEKSAITYAFGALTTLFFGLVWIAAESTFYIGVATFPFFIMTIYMGIRAVQTKGGM